jgi:small subunit ribosomal protein S17
MAKTNEKIGIIKSVKMQKTAVVLVETVRPHPVYKKLVKKTKKFKAENTFEDLKVGDLVKIISTKPISKEKNWKIVEVLKHVAEKK